MGLHTKQVVGDNKIQAFLVSNSTVTGTAPTDHYHQWLWIAQLLYKFANGMTKISLVLLYLRIFPSRTFKIISCCVIVFVISYCTAAVCTSIWQCE